MNHFHQMPTRRASPAALALALVAALAAGGAAQAQDNALRLSATRIDNHSKTTGITGVGAPPGADADAGDATALTFSYERRFTPNIGAELVLGLPVRIHADASGSVSYLGKDVLSTEIQSPTVFANYHFGEAADTWRPYLGIGFNYTRFAKARSKLASDLKLGDSYGLAAQVGLDYAVNDSWGLFLNLAKVDVKSKLVTSGSTVLRTTIDFRPITYTAGLSYRF